MFKDLIRCLIYLIDDLGVLLITLCSFMTGALFLLEGACLCKNHFETRSVKSALSGNFDFSEYE